MREHIRVAVAVLVASLCLLSCQSDAEREKALTAQCKKEATCTKQGLCTGKCVGTCQCIVGSSADCEQSTQCAGEGKCTEQKGKCVVASNADCAKAAACKTAGLCSAKDGGCVIGSDSDCAQSDLCKTAKKCVAKSGACVDASFVPALVNPALANAAAPEQFKVKLTTTKGDIVVEVTKSWAPLGAERFFNLVKIGYYSEVAFFRVDDADAEFGISGNPEISTAWVESKMRDDPPKKQPNDRGYVAFSTTGPSSRWAPLVIHVKSNRKLDDVGYAPFGKVVSGMEVVDSLVKESGVDRIKLQAGGNGYLKGPFPRLDYIKSATVL